MAVWLQPTVSGSWNSSGNWSGGVVPNGIAALAEFNLTGASNILFVDLPDSPSITLGTLNVDLTGGQGLALIGPASGVADLFFNGNRSNAAINFDNHGAGGQLQIGDAQTLIHLVSNLDFNTVAAGSRAIVYSNISGGSALNKIGAGSLELSGTNTFTGGINLSGGQLDAFGTATLGTGTITISNGAALRSTGSISQTISTLSGTANAAALLAYTGNTLSLTGVLNHNADGYLTFGGAGNSGIITASFSSLVRNATTSLLEILNGTLKVGNAYSAANLFMFSGNGNNTIWSSATLDTNGFATQIKNLTFSVGTIRSTSGTLNLTVYDTRNVSILQNGTISGSAGTDIVTYNIDFRTSHKFITYSNWQDGVDQIIINGSANSNTLEGSTASETINGFDGNDTLQGNGGTDFINGGNGDDKFILDGAGSTATVSGGVGTDRLTLGNGSASVAGVSGFETIELANNAILTLTAAQLTNGISSNATLSGTGRLVINMASGDLVLMNPMTVLAGSNLVVTVNGSTGVDVIKCNLNTANTISGGDNVDQIRGGNLADTINGGNGNDKIMGLTGGDLLTGGAGADQFRYLFSNDSLTGVDSDQILDFVTGSDKLDFRFLDADPFTAGRQTLTFIATADFVANGIGQVRYADLGADLRVYIDLNGDGATDMEIRLIGAGAQALSASDFLF